MYESTSYDENDITTIGFNTPYWYYTFAILQANIKLPLLRRHFALAQKDSICLFCADCVMFVQIMLE